MSSVTFSFIASLALAASSPLVAQEASSYESACIEKAHLFVWQTYHELAEIQLDDKRELLAGNAFGIEWHFTLNWPAGEIRGNLACFGNKRGRQVSQLVFTRLLNDAEFFGEVTAPPEFSSATVNLPNESISGGY